MTTPDTQACTQKLSNTLTASQRLDPVVHLLGSLGPALRVALFWPDRGAKFMEKTFPRLVQTGEGSSVNSTSTKFIEKPSPLAASDGGRLLHKLDSKQNPGSW